MTLYRMIRESDSWKIGEAHITDIGNGTYGCGMRLENNHVVHVILPKWLRPKPENEKLCVAYCQMIDCKERTEIFFRHLLCCDHD